MGVVVVRINTWVPDLNAHWVRSTRVKSGNMPFASEISVVVTVFVATRVRFSGVKNPVSPMS